MRRLDDHAMQRAEHETLEQRTVEEWDHSRACPVCYPPMDELTWARIMQARVMWRDDE